MTTFYKALLLTGFLVFWGMGLSYGQIISQYVETNSGTTPKGIEIWNNTGSDIIFSPTNNLEISEGNNGGACSALPGTNIDSGTLTAGEVWVIGTPDIITYVEANGSDLSGSTDFGFTFNGDDALEVRLGGILIDMFGICGSDPGSAWSGSGVSTANQNIELLGSITTGNPSGFTDPSTRFSTVSTAPSSTGGLAGFGDAPVPPSTPPTGVSTGTAGSITAASAIITGNDVTGDGGSTITERGVAYSTSSSPTIADNTVTDPGTTGTFDATISGLSGSTQYFVRAYATNAVGTTYGDEIDFTTNAPAGDSESDIIENTGFTYPTNIDYTSAINSGPLTTGNSVEVAQFTIRDGGGGTDADALSTTLTNLDLSVSEHTNLDRVALFNGSTLVQEVAAASSVSFTGLSLSAADDNTQDFSVRVSFQSTVTDNAQLEFKITAATAQAGGSLFATGNAGGAGSSISGDINRIEVTASDLIFDQGVSTVQELSVMSPFPTVQAVDANVNLDLDYTGSVSVSITTGLTTFDPGATTSVSAINGIATFDNLIFNTVATGNVLTASSVGLSNDVSSPFDVTALPTFGWQIDMADTDFIIDFDNTVSGVNNGQFDGSGLSPTPSAGQLNSDAWAITGMSDGSIGFGGTGTSGDFARGNSAGGVTTGGLYAFETSSGNFSLGIQPGTNDMAPGDITLRVQNSTGNTLESVNIDYTIYDYNDQDRSNSLNFSWSTDDITYNPVSSLDFATVEMAAGSPAWTSTPRSTGFNVSLNDGDYLYLRWNTEDISGSGSRDEIAIDDIVINGGLMPLPVDLLTFTATPRNRHAVLNWTFDNARGFDRFVVEHRTERQDWTAIETVPYTDNISRSKQAQVIHRNPAGGVNYYRLRMIDRDGSEELSRIRSLRFEGRGLIAPVNTMVNSELIVRRDGEFNDEAKLMIIDLQGRVLYHQSIMGDQQDVNIPMTHFSTGMYLLQVITPEATNTFKLYKE